MQRLFSSFPNGGPGIGLLLLRSAAAGVAILQGVQCLIGSPDPPPHAWVPAALSIVSAIAILIGVLTPVASLLLVVTIALFWFPHRSAGVFLDTISSCLIAVNAIAIALLGPGAFSLDARLFGRREIYIFDDTPPTKP